jgi:predicted GNAT family acetyltransferase
VTDTIRGGFLPEGKSPVEIENARILGVKKAAGIDLTEVVRRKAREEAERAVRTGTAGKPAPNRATFFLPGNETDKAVRAGFLSDPKPSTPTPDASIRDLASTYAKRAGVEYKPSREYGAIDPDLSKRLADFYESAVSAPEDPAVAASYNALAREVLDQYKAMTEKGYSIEPFSGEGEPYKSSAEAVADIRDNKHLYFLQTDKAFGFGADKPTNNPMLADSGIVVGGQRLPVNDIFRAVHDFFGHGKEGYQFGPRGEFNAWRTHAEMFSPEAQGALAAETLAQNSWVNYGKHLRDASGNIPQKGQPGYKGPTERPFGEQKNILIPDELIREAREKASKAGNSVYETPKDVAALDSLAEKALGMSPEEWGKYGSTVDGGITGEAYRMGLGAPSLEFVARLAAHRDAAMAKFREAMTSGDLDAAYPFATKSQMFAEAYGAATDTGSAANPRAGWRRSHPDAKAPFPEAKADAAAPKVGDKGELGRTFLPDSEVPEGVDPIARAAIRTKGGVVFEGAWHGEAMLNLADAIGRGEVNEKLPPGVKSLTDFLDSVMEGKTAAVGWVEDGFTTKSGKFLNRADALTHAEKINQLKDGYSEKGSLREAGVLESDEFKKSRAFLPATEMGKEMAKDGFNFTISGILGNRTVTVTKGGKSVGYISSVQRSPKKAEVVMVNIDSNQRGAGLGEALYREVFTQLKADGVELVSGDVIAPEPLAIRKKLFGKFETLTVNRKKATLEQAFDATEEIKNLSFEPGDHKFVNAVNRIRPDSKFLPSKEPRAVKEASFRDPETGELYSGSYHMAAFKVAQEAGLSDKALERLVDGFVTNDGAFLTREEAFNRAVELKQMTPEDYRAQIEAYRAEELPVATSDNSLETTLFNDVRKDPKKAAFLPDDVKPKGRRDEQGRPVTKDGLVDYPKYYRELAKQKEAAQAASDATTNFSKYAVSDKEAPESSKPTGWILPDGEFVALDDAYHQDFLAKNRVALNDQFGTEFLSKTGNLEDRLVALNSGFVRIRDINGSTAIELNQKFYKGALKKAIEDRVLGGLDSIDKLRVSLLDNAGNVVDSAVGKFFDAENPVAVATDMLNGLKSGTAAPATKGPGAIARARAMGGDFLPGDERPLPGFSGKGGTREDQRTVRNRIAESRDFPEALPLEFAKNDDGSYRIQGGKPTPIVKEYELNKSPLAAEAAKGIRGEGPREQALVDALAERLVKEHAKAAKNPEVKAGETWYSTARTLLKNLLGTDVKLFTELLGATSARTAVDLNFKFSLEAYNQFKSGAYDGLLDKYREGKKNFDAGDFEGYPDQQKPPTRAAYLDWWIEKHNLTPLQSNGKKFGMNSRAVLKVLDGSWASEVQGPKTPNFTGNLAGTTFEATVDVWAMRLLHRLANLGNEKRWRLLPGNETGVSNTDFFIGQKAFRKAADAIGISPDALQAILWFAEKDHWTKQGWTKSSISSAKSDFNSLLSTTERTSKGLLKRTESEVAPELDLGLNLDDINPKK